MADKKRKTSNAAPMTYESGRHANLSIERARLRRQAKNMSAEELQRAAAAAQIDTGSARSKKQVNEAVKAATSNP